MEIEREKPLTIEGNVVERNKVEPEVLLEKEVKGEDLESKKKMIEESLFSIKDNKEVADSLVDTGDDEVSKVIKILRTEGSEAAMAEINKIKDNPFLLDRIHDEITKLNK